MAGIGRIAFVFLICIAAAAAARVASGQSQDQPPPAMPTGTGQQQPVPQRVRVSQGVAQGLRVKMVPPKYPKKARKKGIQGTVLLHVMISKTGDVTTVELVSGDPLLASAAIDAVKQWKYKPFLLNGQAVEVDTQIQVNFTLSG
jgi:protein TonB